MGEKDESSFKPKISCFLCEGPQKAMDYPQRAKLVAIIKEAKLGTLHLLSAMKAKED